MNGGKELINKFIAGLDEGIYCAMCTNQLANEQGCDGNCQVDKTMYHKVMSCITEQLDYATNHETISPFSDDIGQRRRIMEKKVYIVTNHDNAYSTAIKISEEQARAIDWLIELADLNYSCVEPTETDCEEI